MRKPSGKRIYRSIFVVLVVAVGYLVYSYLPPVNPQTAGLTRVPRYVDHGVCTALSPECGLCYGQVIDQQCYVDKAVLTPEKLRLMGL